jgi:hypothetical protein
VVNQLLPVRKYSRSAVWSAGSVGAVEGLPRKCSAHTSRSASALREQSLQTHWLPERPCSRSNALIFSTKSAFIRS